VAIIVVIPDRFMHLSDNSVKYDVMSTTIARQSLEEHRKTKVRLKRKWSQK